MEFCTFPAGAQWNKRQTGLLLMTSSEQLTRFRRLRRSGNLNCAVPCAPPCCNRRAGGVEAVGVWLRVRNPQVGFQQHIRRLRGRLMEPEDPRTGRKPPHLSWQRGTDVVRRQDGRRNYTTQLALINHPRPGTA